MRRTLDEKSELAELGKKRGHAGLGNIRLLNTTTRDTDYHTADTFPPCILQTVRL